MVGQLLIDWREKMKIIISRVKKILAMRQVIQSMVVKNLKDKYVGSALGISWAVINPLLITLVVTFVFTRIMKTETRHFPLLVLSGLLPWLFFVNSICEATNSIRQNLDILGRFLIPKEVVPLSVVCANFINFLLGLVIMVPVFLIFNLGAIKYLWLLPFIMLLHFAFTLGVSLLFSIVNVYFRDLAQLLNVGVMFLFWMTPVFYTLEAVPTHYRWLVLLNPATSYIVIYQELLYRGACGSLYIWLISLGVSLLSVVFGYHAFINKENEILKCI